MADLQVADEWINVISDQLFVGVGVDGFPLDANDLAGKLALGRTISQGGRAITGAIAKAYKLTAEAAETSKRESAFAPHSGLGDLNAGQKRMAELMHASMRGGRDGPENAGRIMGPGVPGVKPKSAGARDTFALTAQPAGA